MPRPPSKAAKMRTSSDPLGFARPIHSVLAPQPLHPALGGPNGGWTCGATGPDTGSTPALPDLAEQARISEAVHYRIAISVRKSPCGKSRILPLSLYASGALRETPQLRTIFAFVSQILNRIELVIPVSRIGKEKRPANSLEMRSKVCQTCAPARDNENAGARGFRPDRRRVLVNNAGALASESYIEEFCRALEMNLLAAFDLSRVAHTAFRAHGRGNIINVSSVVGLSTLPQRAFYGARRVVPADS